MSGEREHSFVSDPPQDYMCQVCMKVLQEPHATECCGQHFCRGCLEKWFQKNLPGNKVCPHCRQEGFSHILYKPLQRKINELEVYCPNRKVGCSKILKLADLDSHLTSDDGCGHVSIACPNTGCGECVLRVHMPDHLKTECIKREEKCCYCNIIVTHDVLDNHYEECEEMPISCPRNCDATICRRDLKEHEGVCPYMPIKCPFYDAGCKEQVLRQDLDRHVEGNATSHLMTFMASYSTLKADHDKLKAGHEQLKATHERLEADHKVLEAGHGMLEAENETLRKEFGVFKSQAAIAVTRIQSALEEPELEMLLPLNSVVSSLSSCQLKCVGDSLTFPVPNEASEWTSPPFVVSPGYSFFVRIYSEREPGAVELCLLNGDDLEWPIDIDKTINISLYAQRYYNRRRVPEGVERVVKLKSMKMEPGSVIVHDCREESMKVVLRTNCFMKMELRYITVSLKEYEKERCGRSKEEWRKEEWDEWDRGRDMDNSRKRRDMWGREKW